MPANEQVFESRKKPPRHYPRNVTFPEILDEGPENLEQYGSDCDFRESRYDIIEYYDRKIREDFAASLLAQNSREHEIPEGYEGSTSPTPIVSSGSVERRIEEGHERLFLLRAAVLDTEVSTGNELRHKLFTNVMQVRA